MAVKRFGRAVMARRISVGICAVCAGTMSVQAEPPADATRPIKPPTLHETAEMAAMVADTFDEAKAERVDAMLEPIRTEAKLPALAAAIVRGEGLAAIGAVGVRKQGDDTPVTIKDKFHLGSCTKSMTATLIATMVERGELGWDDTLGQRLPEVAPSMDEAFRKATLAQLLTHRAGVASELNRDGLWGALWGFSGSPTDARALLAKTVLSWKPESTPGTKFLYANAGTAIAGHIAEVVAKEPYEELMRERIFGPLGMTSAGFGAPGEQGSIDQPRGHRGAAAIEPSRMADNPAAISPAGRVHASMADWGRYIALHLRGFRGDVTIGDTVIRKATFERMHTPVTGDGGDYAMGWSVTRRPWGAAVEGGDSTVLMHAGSNTMWFCVVWMAPNADFAVLVATNTAGPAAERACDAAASMLIEHYVTQTRAAKGEPK